VNSCSFPYVPQYIEGELLFSWVSRLHFLNARANPRQTLSELFGSGTGIPSADMPCRLQTFVGRTAGWGPFASADAAAISATLFPYYSLFLTPERYQKSLDALRKDRADGLKVAMGIVSNGFGASTTLRSCWTCDHDCMDRHGCSVLYRMHQLPGMLICPIHGEPLCQHLLQSRQPHRQQLIVPVREPFNRSVHVENLCLQRIAALSSEALTTAPTGLTSATRSQAYMRRLVEHGFLLDGRVDWRALAKAVQEEYGDFVGLPFRPRLMSSERFPLRWLYDLCRRPDRSLHPLCHLLLIGLLFGSVHNFVSFAAQPAASQAIGIRSNQRDNTRNKAHSDAVYALLANQALTCRQEH
jgi:hypothetical protein